jgi:hypothetical protein
MMGFLGSDRSLYTERDARHTQKCNSSAAFPPGVIVTVWGFSIFDGRNASLADGASKLGRNRNVRLGWVVPHPIGEGERLNQLKVGEGFEVGNIP